MGQIVGQTDFSQQVDFCLDYSLTHIYVVNMGQNIMEGNMDKKEKPHVYAVFQRGFGRSEVTRTPGILLPKQARYQLRYTPILNFCGIRRSSQSRRATNCATPRHI